MPLVGVLVAFAAVTAALVPVLTPVAIHDDWIYARAVQTLLDNHRLEIGDLSAASLVAQVLWGAGVSAIFGFSFGALRLSTLAVAMLGGVGMYGLCRELGVGPRRAAMVVATYLFNPLVYVLANTFMTDIHFASWALLAVWAYVRGLRTSSGGWLLSGSALCSVAVLVRQQGLLIAVAVAVGSAIEGRRAILSRLSTVTRIMLLPALALGGYLAWALLIRGGIPAAQGGFLRAVESAGIAGVLSRLWSVPFIQLSMLGLAAVPLLVGLSPRGLRLTTTRASLIASGIVLMSVLVSFAVFTFQRRSVPYASSFLTDVGLGPQSLVGARPRLVGGHGRLVLSVIAVGAACVLILLMVRRLGMSRAKAPGAWTTGPGIVTSVLIGQVAGSLLPSLYFGHGDGTLDRYLVPGIAFGLVLAGWATRDIATRVVPSIAVLAVAGFFAVVGTRDYLNHEAAVWRTADSMVATGVGRDKIDGGPAWTGWRVSDGSFLQHTPRTQEGPWWLTLFAPLTDSTFVISDSPANRPGYRRTDSVAYDDWLHVGPDFIYVFRR